MYRFLFHYKKDFEKALELVLLKVEDDMQTEDSADASSWLRELGRCLAQVGKKEAACDALKRSLESQVSTKLFIKDAITNTDAIYIHILTAGRLGNEDSPRRALIVNGSDKRCPPILPPRKRRE